MNRKKRNAFLPIILLFVVLNGIFIAGKTLLQRIGADQEVLIYGNIFLLIIFIISFLLAQKGVQSTNTHAFVRGVYGGILVKLFACIIAAFIYISLAGDDLNKPALFVCMGLYFVYTFIEVSILMKMLKEKPNVEKGSTH